MKRPLNPINTFSTPFVDLPNGPNKRTLVDKRSHISQFFHFKQMQPDKSSHRIIATETQFNHKSQMSSVSSQTRLFWRKPPPILFKNKFWASVLNRGKATPKSNSIQHEYFNKLRPIEHGQWQFNIVRSEKVKKTRAVIKGSKLKLLKNNSGNEGWMSVDSGFISECGSYLHPRKLRISSWIGKSYEIK